MTMKVVKKTADYTVYQRGDERYAVKDAEKKPVNGDEKVRILLEEGLIKVAAPAAPAEPEPAAEAEEAPEAEEATSEEPEAAAEAEGEDDGEKA